jgi:hypothetical protein
MNEARSDERLVEGMDGMHALACSALRRLFGFVAEADRAEVWRSYGARDMAHWLWMRFGLSDWKARRWIAAAHALERLPLTASAFAGGEIGVDQVVELTRLATPETEARLLTWARNASSGAIRARADRALRQTQEDVRAVEEDRRLTWWWFDEGKRFGLEAELPAAQGAVVARALTRIVDSVPVLPGEEESLFADARRADALVALASARIAGDPDPDRASVVVHASVDPLGPRDTGFEIEGGPPIPAASAARLLCNARSQTVLENPAGTMVVGLGRMTREPSAWMVRQVRHRDRGCTFPRCGSRRFTEAHHIVWWERGGWTDLDNLTLVCWFHHKLVHEHGWTIRRGSDGGVGWFRPDRTRFRSGPAPPSTRPRRDAAVSRYG